TIISNELPRLNDASGALAGRLLILKFTNSFFGREDKGLSEALHDERQGILLWAIGGWESLRRSGRFIEPEASKELVEQMADIASPITAFVGDCCEIDPLGESFLSDLYSHFRHWSESNGIDKPVSLPVFSRDLTAAYPQLQRSRTRSGAGPDSKARTIKGVRLGGE
ncbi:MAG TPA: DNA primase, partial [Planctomycetaceae bacterium]|nr:DNA primase [Planctomycetaceae bacterium]